LRRVIAWGAAARTTSAGTNLRNGAGVDAIDRFIVARGGLAG
jgi:hypothetical protein